jgi:hypothetical protein
MSKLTDEQVTEIKDKLFEGLTQPEIAEMYGVSRSLISDIATERVHKDVPGPTTVKKQGGQHKATPQHDPTDERVKSLESEVLHLRAERDHARRSAKAAAKNHGLFLAVKDEMQKLVVPYYPLPPARELDERDDVIEEHLVMHISDMHADQIVVPTECGGLEEYNFSIACRRAETYVDTVIDWTQRTLQPRFNFRHLTILCYGDQTSGEIHGNMQRSAFRNSFKNSLAIGQLQALMIRDLAPYFESINVVCVPGNHGRRSVKKDYHGAHDNFDYLVAKAAELYCQDIGNVNFLIPDSWSVNLAINGIGFSVSHGDDVGGSLGIPFYGMVRRQKGLMALGAMQGGTRIRYYVMGHHHLAASLQDLDGELIVNGPWIATDAYSYNKFAGYREPSQLIHGVNKKHGISWRMLVHLKSKGEKKGPRRYKVTI